MSMHWSGEQRLKMNRKLSDLRDHLEEMRLRNKAVVQEKHDLEEENQQLRRSYAGLKASLAEVESSSTMTAI
jgi:predicted nuclease with TOPRIM domain